jgi:hypothetical protein
MAGNRIVSAIEELYGLDPSEFTDRRNALAAAARRDGAVDDAKHIAALRRPTRAAWVLNQLARSNPELAGEFAALGAELVQAHNALDGAQIRELTRQRRVLIDQTAQQAFVAAAVGLPTSTLREDVMTTLGAVLADPDIAQRFAAGALVTAEDQSGFGPAGAVLTSVASPPTEPGDPARSSPRESVAERRRKSALAKAEGALLEAEQAQEVAAEAVSQASEAARHLTEQLADARRREDDAILDARHADLRLDQARTAYARAQKL